MFVESLSGYPSLTPISNASLKYHLVARPDIKPVCFLWKENIFIGPGSQIPGINSISTQTIEMKEYRQSRISSINVSISPSLSKFEQVLLDKISYNHVINFPESVISDMNVLTNPPMILERRLHLGYHNSYTFLHQPIIVNLNTDNESSDLQFKGNIELDKYFPNHPDIHIVFMIEFKVSLNVNIPKDSSKWPDWMMRMFNSSAKEGDTIQNIEKFICVGWGTWHPIEFHNNLNDHQVVTLNNGSQPNPFTSLMYRSTIDSYEDKIFENQENLMIEKDVFHNISFNFNSNVNMLNSTESYNSRQTTTCAPFEIMPSNVREDIEKTDQIHDEENNSAIEAPPTLEYDHEIVEVPRDEFDSKVIEMPSPKPSKLKYRLSRVERARLLNARFDTNITEKGDKPIHILLNDTDSTKLKPNLDIERNDTFLNDISITFCGITFDDSLFEIMAGKILFKVHIRQLSRFRIL